MAISHAEGGENRIKTPLMRIKKLNQQFLKNNIEIYLQIWYNVQCIVM